MNQKFDFPTTEGRKIVYVRPVAVEDLPKEMRDQAAGRKHLYAVHDENGVPLALVPDRRLAFVLARRNDMSPVSVN